MSWPSSSCLHLSGEPPERCPSASAGSVRPPSSTASGRVPSARRRSAVYLIGVPAGGCVAAERGNGGRRSSPPCGCRLRSPEASAQLLDAEQVAGGIAEGAVADPVGLLGRLLDDFGAAGLQPLERAVEVLGGQEEAGVGALGHHLDDGAALVLRDAGV